MTLWRDGDARPAPSREDVVALLQDPGALIAVRLGAPDAEDWRWLAEAFALPASAVEQAQRSSHRASLAVYPELLALTVRSWRNAAPRQIDDLADVTSEVDLFLGRRFLLEIWPDTPAERPAPRAADSAAMLLQHFLESLLDSCYPAMDALDVEIDALETAVYTGSLPTNIGEALERKKRLLLLRQTVAPVRDLIGQLLRLDIAPLDPEAIPFLQNIYDRALRLTEQIDLHREILSGVMEATMAQTSNRLNEQMKRLTAIAAMALPITAITGFFGMNIGHLERAPSWALWAAITGMASASLTALLWFRRKGYW